MNFHQHADPGQIQPHLLGHAADHPHPLEVALRVQPLMIATRGLVHVPVGGGIVADSNPDAEYEETWVKARAMLGALGVEGRI